MPFAWPDLHHRLVRSSTSHRFQQQYAGLRRSHAALLPFQDPPALLEYLNHGTDPSNQKNVVLRALVRAAQAEDDSTALSLMLLALWPGLDAVRRRLIGRWRVSTSEPVADLLSRTCEVIRTLDLGRVTWVAATVLRNLERDIGRQIRREAEQRAVLAAIEPHGLPAVGGVAEPSPDARLLWRDLEQQAGQDADLLVQVAVCGLTQAEAGRLAGLSEAAARKRHQRATHRLRETLH